MSNTIDINSYKPKITDSFFFDNNIWMYLFCPIGNHQVAKQKSYSNFYKEIVTTGKTIYVNSLVLSEFSNSYLRLDFNIWRKKEGVSAEEYKTKFVGTIHHRNTVETVVSSINGILKNSTRVSDDFHMINMATILSAFEIADFNDAYYLVQAKKNNWKIVSDDNDLKKNQLGIEIITA